MDHEPLVPLDHSSNRGVRVALCLLPLITILSVASTGADGIGAFLPMTLSRISVGNAAELQLLETLPIPEYAQGAVSHCSVDFSPDGCLLVVACGRSRVPAWDLSTGEPAFFVYDAASHVVACAFSPDGTVLATGDFESLCSP